MPTAAALIVNDAPESEVEPELRATARQPGPSKGQDTSTTVDFDAVIEQILDRGVATAVDVAHLRRGIYGRTGATFDHIRAARLFAANTACEVVDPRWAPFFVEALSDYLIDGAEPSGYLSAENAAWLLEQIEADGTTDSATELELLIVLMERARFVPCAITSAALNALISAINGGTQVTARLVRETGKRAGRTNNGSPATRPAVLTGAERAAGVVTADDVTVLRRVLYAAGGDGHHAISRLEAEALLTINDTTDAQRNDPAWSDLFVKALANHIMFVSGYRVPTRQEALQRDRWLESRPGVAGFLSRILTSGPQTVWSRYTEQSSEQRALARLAEQRRAMLLGEEVTSDEANWLSDRLMRDGCLNAAEQALLDFLQAEHPTLHPSLQRLITQAAA